MSWRARLAYAWRTKLVLLVTLNAAFWAVYGWLGRHAVFTPRTVPLTWLDRTIPFSPSFWAWIYLSQFAITGGVPWLLDSRDAIRRYVVGVAVICAVAFPIFLLAPVASPRPVAVESTAMMRWIVRYDGQFNAFPSLHAAFLAFIGGRLWRMFATCVSPAWKVAWAAWTVAILYATLATRQHYAVDLIAGVVIGCFADVIAGGSSGRANAAAAIARSTVVASQEG